MTLKHSFKHESDIKKAVDSKFAGEPAKRFAKSASSIPSKPDHEQNPHFILGYN